MIEPNSEEPFFGCRISQAAWLLQLAELSQQARAFMTSSKVAAENMELQGNEGNGLGKHVELYRHMRLARQIDALEERYVSRGEAAFSVSGAGHEAIAALNQYLIPSDYLHLHYRDKALMLARGITPVSFFKSFFGKSGSFSEGRQMSAHPAERGLNILSLTGPVGNHALQAVGVAAEVAANPDDPVVVCSFGDGTAQQGEVLEAIAEAVRSRLPVLFIIEDNRLAISTRTAGKTFFDLPQGPIDAYCGLPIRRLDGSDALACTQAFKAIIGEMRNSRLPALIHLSVERLASHTNSDDQALYRHADEITHARDQADPIDLYRRALIGLGVSEELLRRIDDETQEEVQRAAKLALSAADPAVQVCAKRPLPEVDAQPPGNAPDTGRSGGSMLEAIQRVLRERLATNVKVTLYGQDIEDPKGDVFGVTRGLSSQFPGRVVNAPLSESTIVGTSIGRALAGGKPVAFLQFADFLPLAFNQIASELGSMYWRTAGAWECPVIILIACGGYRDGLGPFHAQTMESIALHVPGIDVMMPSNGSDCASLLNAAFDSGRPTLFFYPKACLNREEMRDDFASHAVAPAPFPLLSRKWRTGSALTLVCYGSTVQICCDAADAISKAGASVEVIDLCSLSPWDEAAVIASVEKTGRIIVVHEDNRTCGFGAEILATVLEKTSRRVQARRIVREDTYVPYNFRQQQEVLPSFERVLAAAADLLEMALTWITPCGATPGVHVLHALASGPSDQLVTLMDWHAAEGQEVLEGQTLGSLEGMKCVFDFDSPVNGRIDKLLVKQGESIAVGQPIAHIHIADGARAIFADQRRIPVLRPLEKSLHEARPSAELALTPFQVKVGITAIAVALGSREVANDALLQPEWKYGSADIARMTGIHSRRRIAEGESVVSLGTLASRQVLDKAGLSITDIDLVICATGTPDIVSPAVACRILDQLGGSEHGCPAYDISAACSGYLYGLGQAHDFLSLRPEGRVLLITSEIISPLINEKDFGTSILFGDGATATVLSGADHENEFHLYLDRPYLSARAEPGQFLRAPHADSESALYMEGMKVFEWGVRCMSSAVRKVCTDAGVAIADIDLLVPHQANKRIIETVCQQLKVPSDRLYMNLANIGNTSSSSVPICLADLLANSTLDTLIGTAAFGAGFTYGACLLKTPSFNKGKK